jgi:cytochrome c oxidase cbb3-type subunit III
MTRSVDFSGFSFRLRTVAVAASFLAVSLVADIRPQQREPSRSAATSHQVDQGIADGRQVFESRCAGCHGLDGRGGERAPDIATSQKVQRRSDAEITQIIENGIPAAGMPAFPMMDSSRVRSLIEYLHLLQGKTGPAALPGDPQNGKALFSGKAKCSECHTILREGGFIAADLSRFGRTHSLDEIREAITNPNRDKNSRRPYVLVITRDHRKHSGVVRNEDNFSVQLQTLDGAFHLFLKADLESLTRQPVSLMPSNYGTTLSPAELNDLISFLMTAANEQAETGSSGEPKRGEEDE